MDTSRLRKTFQYASDDHDSDPSSHDELDEQEQETLISNLRSKETTSDARYTLFFTILPLAVVPVFLYYLPGLTFSTKGNSRTRFLPLWCLLSVTSLLSTAYMMWFVKLSASDTTSGLMKKVKGLGQKRQQQRKALYVDDDEGPIQKFLPALNAGICGLLCLAAWANRGRENDEVPDGFWMFLLLPPVMFGMTIVARQSMAEVQSGIGELEGMKYDYKGA